MIYVGENEVTKIYNGSVEITELAIGEAEVPVVSGDTPVVAKTYYVQLSGGSLTALTETENEGEYSYFFTAGSHFFVYEDSVDITSAITLLQPDVYNAIVPDGEGCLLAQFGPATLYFYPDPDNDTYSIYSENGDIQVYISGSLADTIGTTDGTYYFTPYSSIDMGSSLQIKGAGMGGVGTITYPNKVVCNTEAYESSIATENYLEYCADDGVQISIGYLDYGEGNKYFQFDYPSGSMCAPNPFIYADGMEVAELFDCDGEPVLFPYPENTEVDIYYPDYSHFDDVTQVNIDGIEIGTILPLALPVEVEYVSLCGGVVDFTTPNGDFEG